MKAPKTSLGVAIAAAVIPSLLWLGMTTTFSLENGDFAAFYTGAVMAKQGQFGVLHDESEQVKVQARFQAGRPDHVFFVRPHIYAAVLSPLALLPMRPAFYVWSCIQGAILLAIAIWARRRFGNDALVLLGLFPPAILAIGFGQDAVVFLGIAVASYALYERGQLLAAGFVLGCGFIKPHLLLLFPVALIVQKRWRMLAGFALGGAVEAGISLALAGIGGAKVYLAFLRNQEGHLTPNPERMLNVHGMMVNLGLESPAIRFALVAAVVVCAIVIARRSEWWEALVAAQIGTILIAPHVFMYDSCLVVLPALLVYFKQSGIAARVAATVFFVPFPYLLQLADKPWTIAPSLAILSLLLALLFEASPSRRTQPVN
jgi:hypothetical protein